MLQSEIARVQKDSDEILKQISEDTKLEIEDIAQRNESNKTQVQDMSLKSKAELQITHNRIWDLEQDIESLKRQDQDKEH
jgi:hypothetical protein